MTRLPGTGIPLNSSLVATNALVVCGESPKDVFAIVESKLHDWQAADLSWGFREFYFRSYQKSKVRLNVLVGGLGSASTELILQEGTLAGIRNFILSGSCASLRGLPVGTLITPVSVMLRPGALSEYIEPKAEVPCDGALQAQLVSHLNQQNILHHPARCLSTDAFYAIGGSYDSAKNPNYAGASLKNKQLPCQLNVALQNTLQADALDMECAPFFALGSLLDNVQVAAVKAVSNQIPWNLTDFDEARIRLALEQAIGTALDFTVACAQKTLRA